MPSKWESIRTRVSPDRPNATRPRTTMASLSLRLYQKTDPKADFAVLLENKKSKNSLLFQAGTVATLCKYGNGEEIRDGISRLSSGRVLVEGIIGNYMDRRLPKSQVI